MKILICQKNIVPLQQRKGKRNVQKELKLKFIKDSLL